MRRLHKIKLRQREDVMRRSVVAVGIVMGLIAAWSVGRLQGQAQADKVIFVSANHANFTETPGAPKGVSTAALWGEATAGAHGTFTKFAPGYDAGMHMHTNDVWIVGVKGAYVYKDESGEKRVGPGDFLRAWNIHQVCAGIRCRYA